MNEKHIFKISEELNLSPQQVQATVGLLNEEATVPFIARYRKEVTGSLDEVAVTSIRDRLIQLAELDKRREAILKSLEERNQLTEDLNKEIQEAETMVDLEDIYLPYRPKRRTRATMAREKGLEPLAQLLFEQGDIDLMIEALVFVDPEKGVDSAEDALSGARDIIAEWVNEDQTARSRMRSFYASKAVIKSKVIPEKEDLGIKYRDYYAWEEPAATAPSHRVLAIRRGEKEDFLSLKVVPQEEEALEILDRLFVKGEGSAAEQVRMAVHDSYKRLLSLSMETEIRLEIKKRADEEAIRVFAENLRQLLLSPPLGQKRVLAIDPGFRTGCKVACLDGQGKLIHHETIFLLSEKSTADAGARILGLCERFQVEVIAVGNGTAGRETETFIRGLVLPSDVQVVMVNESGASIYSASEAAREEFPDQDLTVRGSVSIGRRLMDPLAELVKIDPKSIGVGQYQHDVDQNALKNSLDDVVVHCVNRVGVEVNTASKQLLAYVSGLGPGLAKGILDFRNQHGPFHSREGLKKVPRLGPKAFEQAAGFLRIRIGENPLDGSAVHPESYPIVDAMALDLGCSVIDLMGDETLRNKIDINRYVSEKVGLPTLQDILAELAKPGRDPREEFEIVRFAEGVEKIEDVKPGMRLPGIVTNITAFGVFVDIGVHQDGLVHVSELAERFVKDPAEVVKVHQKVNVKVLDVDLSRKRISLSMKATRPPSEQGKKEKEIKKEIKKIDKKEKSKSIFSNNPFATAFGKRES
jgi:protein Tex